MSKTILDVRTPQEFMMGHVKNSVNIPLQELESRLDEVKNLKGEIILCCASGVRSARAYSYLKQKGFNKVSNGGSWMDIE
ncbi:MAG TPA: rhodanese-like domain-containing protein [Puia sp.]|nr:rhodanese-like domain-containing protein [Puia sp.]